MADGHTMDPADWLGKQLQAASPDLLREIVATFVAALMNAEVEALCGADYGERSEERVNSRNGYWWRRWGSPGSPSRRSPGWRRSSTPRSRRSAPAHWTPRPTPMSGWTRLPRRSARAGESCRSRS